MPKNCIASLTMALASTVVSIGCGSPGPEGASSSAEQGDTTGGCGGSSGSSTGGADGGGTSPEGGESGDASGGGSGSLSDGANTGASGNGLPQRDKIRLIDAPGALAAGASVAGDARGNVFIAYWVYADTTRLARYDAFSGTWSTKDLGQGGGAAYLHPVVKVDGHGGVHVVTADDYAVRYFYSPDAGVSFAETDILNLGDPANPGSRGSPRNCDMAVDALDTPHVVCSIDSEYAADPYPSGPMYLVPHNGTWTRQALGETGRGGLGLFDKYDGVKIAVYSPPGDAPEPRILGTSGTFAYYDGNRWSIEAVAASLSTGGDPDEMMLTVDTQDTARVLFVPNSGNLYAGERQQSGWHVQSFGSAIPASHAVWLSAAGDAKAVAMINGQLAVLSRNGEAWVETVTSVRGAQSDAVGAIPWGNDLLVAFTGVDPGVINDLVVTRVAP